MLIQKLMESFEDFGLKSVYTVDLFYVSIWRFISTKGQGHYLTFDQRLSKYDNFKHLDPQKPLGYCYQISTSLLGLREQIFVQTVEITWEAQPSYPNIVKYFQNLLQNQLVDGTDNWYVALGTPEIPRVGKKTLRNQPNQVQDPIQDQDCSNNDLGWPWPFYMASNTGKC